MYKVVDLFSGAGGLSLGFEQTGKCRIVAAFENNPFMQETYKNNHPGVEVNGDVCKADYGDITARYGKIDIVIGGPPCQGFSNANRQRNHTINQNNMLVKQYVRAIQELRPKAFVMENVSMLQSDVHRFYLDEKDQAIVAKYDIQTRETYVELIDESHYFKGAEKVVEDYVTLCKYLWEPKHYDVINIIFKATQNKKKLITALNHHRRKIEQLIPIYCAKNDDSILSIASNAFESLKKYYEAASACDDAPVDSAVFDDMIKRVGNAIMVQRMLLHAKEIHDNCLIVDRYEVKKGLCAVIKSYSVYEYIKKVLGSDENGYTLDGKVLCAADYGAPQKRMRFVIMGIRKTLTDKVTFPEAVFTDKEYRTVSDAIKDLESINPYFTIEEDKDGKKLEAAYELSELAKMLRNSPILRNHIVTQTTDIALERFKALKQGQNFHSLDEGMRSNTYTDSNRTQRTIYMRLDYKEPSGTVVNVRKSMWIHPTKDRAISIREAARLQTFPDSFVFYGSKDKQYQQVGNAVPPVLAKAIAEKLLTYLEFSADYKAIDARILRSIKETPGVKQCEIASLLKVSPPYVSMRIADLVQRGILVCTKTNGKKGWRLAEKEDHDGG